jgi:hypothetical protein
MTRDPRVAGKSETLKLYDQIQARLDMINREEESAWELGEEIVCPEHRFYTASRDAKGHSVWVRVRFPVHELADLEQLVKSTKLPYRSVQDLIRDAVTHRLAYIASRPDCLKSPDALFWLSMKRSHEAVEVSKLRLEGMKEKVSDIELCLSHGAVEMARSIMAELQDIRGRDDIPEMCASYYDKSIYPQYSYLLQPSQP